MARVSMTLGWRKTLVDAETPGFVGGDGVGDFVGGPAVDGRRRW